MPSLSALGEFRDSFNNIANEKDNVESRNLPFDRLALPKTEPPPFDPSALESPSMDSLMDDFMENLMEPDSEDSDTGAGDFDFNAFLNSLPGEAGNETALPSEDDLPSIDDLFNMPHSPEPEDELPSIDNQDTTPEDSVDESSLDASLDEPSLDKPPSDEPPSEEPSLEDLLSGESSSDDSSFDASLDEPPSEEPSLEDLLSGESSSDAPSFDASLDEPSFDEPPSEGPSLEDLLSGESSSDAPSFDASLDEPSFDEPPSDEPPGDDGLPDNDFLDSFGSEDIPEDISGDDYSVPEGLLAGLAGEIETSPDDFMPEDFGAEYSGNEGFETESTDSDTGIEGFDFGSQNFDIPDTSSKEEPAKVLDLGGENPDGTFSLGKDDFPVSDESSAGEYMSDFDFLTESANESEDMGSESLGDDPFGFGGETPEPGGNEFLDDVLPDMDFSGTEEPEQDDYNFGSPLSDTDSFQTGADSGFDEMDFSPGSSLGDSDGSDESSELPGFEDFGSDFASESIDLESGPEVQPSGTSGDDDFALPGFDDIFEKNKVKASPQTQEKKGFFSRKKKAEAKKAEAELDTEEVEEIQLSQEDLNKLLATLASYPLNLRVACQELIAEHVILPQQLSKLIRYLIRGAHPKEAAELAGEILGKKIIIPRSFQKITGEAWEAEKASFAYIFIHNFLPVLRLFAVIAALASSLIFLSYRFIYTPLRAESLYKRGYERIFAGEYQRANELFHEAFMTYRRKNWFYQYAEGFRDQRRYLLSEGKYEELLRFYPRDKKGVLDYAHLQTNYLLNYDKANRILQQQLLDFAPNDFDGLLAAGDNFLVWADSSPERFYDKYEEARYSFARILDNYGWRVPVIERMLKFFIRTDDLKEVLYLRNWFETGRNRTLSTPSLAELGGYLLDKQLEEVRGVPDPYVENIESVRDMLLQAVREDPNLPEPHYHLSRYHHSLRNTYEERLTLENAIRAFDLAGSESVRRRLDRVDTHYRYANLLVNNREFFPAEEQLVRGIGLYEDFVSRNLMSPSPQLGRLYAAKGDLEYFVKSGNVRAALTDYHLAERYGWSPPEIQYRMGASYYQLENWGNALEYLFKASAELPLNRRLLFALGNTTYQRGDYFAAQGYYNRLLDILENQRNRLPVLLPNDNPLFLELGERLMMARNNAGVVYEALAEQTGNREYRSRALSLYAESARAWDSITRNPDTMTRMRLTDTPGVPGINLGFLNAGNAMRPTPNFSPEIFIRIDKDVLEPSQWEELAPFGGLTF